MLQARIFSYADAHRYRLGTHSDAASGQRAQMPGTTTTIAMAPMRFDAQYTAMRSPTTSPTPSTARRKTRRVERSRR